MPENLEKHLIVEAEVSLSVSHSITLCPHILQMFIALSE